MLGDVIISVKNLSKAYRIWQSPAARLHSPLTQAAAALFPLLVRDLSPGHTSGTLSNAIDANRHDGLLKWWRWRELNPRAPDLRTPHLPV